VNIPQPLNTLTVQPERSRCSGCCGILVEIKKFLCLRTKETDNIFINKALSQNMDDEKCKIWYNIDIR
jgi:hypothetical protein